MSGPAILAAGVLTFLLVVVLLSALTALGVYP